MDLNLLNKNKPVTQKGKLLQKAIKNFYNQDDDTQLDSLEKNSPIIQIGGFKILNPLFIKQVNKEESKPLLPLIYKINKQAKKNTPKKIMQLLNTMFNTKTQTPHNTNALVEYSEHLYAFIKHPTEENNQTLLINKPKNIGKIKNPSHQLCIQALKKAKYVYPLIKKPTEEINIEFVKIDGTNIGFIDSPSEVVQYHAITNNSKAFEHIKEPTIQIQKQAIKEEPELIKKIKDPSEEISVLALSYDGFLISTIKDPTFKMQCTAIKYNYFILEDIQEPSEELQLYALSISHHTFELIKNPTQKVIEEYKKITKYFNIE